MEFVNRVRNFLLEEEFYFEVHKNFVDIMNYKRIGHFDSEKVHIDYDGGTLVIKGEKLVVSRLMKDEVLVTGTVKSLELR